MPEKPVITREFAQKKYDDARLQRDDAQQKFTAASQQQQASQAAANQAQVASLVAEGAVQQAKAFLDKFDAAPTPALKTYRSRKSAPHPPPAAE